MGGECCIHEEKRGGIVIMWRIHIMRSIIFKKVDHLIALD
jgi:hypothetical protein